MKRKVGEEGKVGELYLKDWVDETGRGWMDGWMGVVESERCGRFYSKLTFQADKEDSPTESQTTPSKSRAQTWSTEAMQRIKEREEDAGFDLTVEKVNLEGGGRACGLNANMM